MEDYLVKALAYDGFVRAYAVSATKLLVKHNNVMILGIQHQRGPRYGWKPAFGQHVKG